LFSPEAGQPIEAAAGWGFVFPAPNTFPPAYLAPSEIDIGGEAATPFTIGEALRLSGPVDMQHLGSALHGFFGADLEGLAHHDRLEIAAGLLARWQVQHAVAPEAVLAAADRLRVFVSNMWPYSVWHREWPIEYVTGEGTTVRGSADLVLEVSNGFVILDHKSFPGQGEAAIERAKTYAGQLAAYADAVSAARRRPILGTYVHLPVAGLIVPVSTKQV
jgi:ATP-dependent helicase/nuclease subunit A